MSALVTYDYNDTDVDMDMDQSDTDTSMDSITDSEYSQDLTAQEHWEESMKQIQGLINFLILPLIGKVLGRRASKIIWSKIAGWYF